MRLASCFALLLLSLPAVAAEVAELSEKQPYELVRELQVFQDEAVLKRNNARAEQRQRIARVAAQLAAFPASAWADPRNARAAVIYVLSGGDPRVLSQLLGSGAPLGIDSALAKGALAYGERRDSEAAELLGGIDIETLDRSVGGHVALVRALLLGKSDQRKAFTLLDRARVMAPGTMVEEAALRRQAVLAAKMGDLDAYEMLSAQYFRRFSNSIFARSFAQQFAEEAVLRDYAGDKMRMQRLEALVRELSSTERREACLAMAEFGIAAGNVEIVRFAARMAAKDAKSDPHDAMRLMLFEAAALVVTPDYEQGLMSLRLVDRAKLGVREESLLDAALAVSREISRPPSAGASTEEPEGANTDSGVVGDAQRALARVDGLLSEATR